METTTQALSRAITAITDDVSISDAAAREVADALRSAQRPRKIGVKRVAVEEAPSGADPLELPSKEFEFDAGADVRAAVSGTIPAGGQEIVPTGIALDIPEGYEVQVRPRSGLAAKRQVTVTNTPGTIDSGYKGQVFVMLINHGEEPFSFDRGERVAQLLLSEVVPCQYEEVDSLSDSERGEGGLGSTGRK